MAQSLASILVHLIFSTKDREPFLPKEIRPELHRYLATVFKDIGCPAIIIESLADHVHILFSLSRDQSVAKVVERVKTGLSKWIKGKGMAYRKFYWQSGYGPFSVSESRRKAVEKYIARQEEHHRVRTFQEEFREFLRRYRVPYDERYVWD